jgi:acyl carrier protein
MAMKMPVSASLSKSGLPDSLNLGEARSARVDCSTARHLLANTLGRSRSEIADHQRLEELIEDSLVRETVILEFEDFLGREIDRKQFCRAKTVGDLAKIIAA